MIKKRLEWKPESLFGGKYGRRFWKDLDNAKSKKELKDELYDLAWKVEILEERLNELKKYIGERRE